MNVLNKCFRLDDVIKKYLLSLFLLSFVLLYACASEPQVLQGKVIKVSDGDSINILHDGETVRVRLAEIDAPERGQPFWRKSREALADHVAGKDVEVIVFDVDRYKRIVGQVYVDDLWVNGALVQGGYAYVYPDYATTMKLYSYEADAKNNEKGIWKLPEAERVKPWEWRKQKRESTSK